MALIDMFENISIPFEYRLEPRFQLIRESLNQSNRNAIIAEVKGIVYNESENSNKISKIQDRNPIESIASKRFYRRKCFTFFSKFSNRWKNFKIKDKIFKFLIFRDKDWFPPDANYKEFYYFSIHSPNTLPEMEYEDNYIKLNFGYFYHIYYSRIYTKLLPPSYSTNCRNYNISNVNEDQSRKDCVNRCILNDLKEDCGHCFHLTGALFRKEFVKIYSSESLCPADRVKDNPKCTYDSLDEIESKCETNCRPNCNNHFIDFKVKGEERNKELDWNSATQVMISHSRLPDEQIEHSPEMTFISFIANFGGLLGMWLGLSAVTIYDLITSFLFNLFTRF